MNLRNYTEIYLGNMIYTNKISLHGKSRKEITYMYVEMKNIYKNTETSWHPIM